PELHVARADPGHAGRGFANGLLVPGRRSLSATDESAPICSTDRCSHRCCDLEISCLAIPCEATQTCRRGACVSAVLDDLWDCTEPRGCDGEPVGGSGGFSGSGGHGSGGGDQTPAGGTSGGSGSGGDSSGGAASGGDSSGGA